MATDEQTRGVGIAASTLIGVGGLFYHRYEDLSWLDSFYFTIVTLTTVGYGDFSPQTAVGKIFTMVYLLIGIGVLVALITEVARHLIGASDSKPR